MTTGIDWKSLTIPASLPTTFDVVPSADELQRDYTHNCYTLIHVLSSRWEHDAKSKPIHNVQNNHEPVSPYERDCTHVNRYHDICSYFRPDNMKRQRIAFDELIDHRLSQVDTYDSLPYARCIHHCH
jgi:hypothetical protein